MGLVVNLLPMARNYSLQQSGVDKLYDNPPRDQQQARQAQMPQANGENGVRESRADDEVGALDADSNDSIRELEELLTKLNPLAKEFIPPSHADAVSPGLASSIPKQNYRKVADACFLCCFSRRAFTTFVLCLFFDLYTTRECWRGFGWRDWRMLQMRLIRNASIVEQIGRSGKIVSDERCMCRT